MFTEHRRRRGTCMRGVRTHHKAPRRPQKQHKKSTPRVGEDLPAGHASRPRGTAERSRILELQDALVDVEGVRHDDGVRDALPAGSRSRARRGGSLTVFAQIGEHR